MTAPRPAYLLVVLLVSAAASAHYFGIVDLLSLERLNANRDELLAWVATNPLLAALVFMAVYAGIVALSLPVATIVSLLGGFLFGRWLGTALIVSAATLGATAIFCVAKSSFGATLRDKAGPLYHKVAEDMQVNAFAYLLFMRLVPVFPFFLVNIVPALFRVRTRTYVIATLVGIVPGTFVYANLGRELGTLASLKDLISMPVLLAFCMLGILALVPAVYSHVKAGR